MKTLLTILITLLLFTAVPIPAYSNECRSKALAGIGGNARAKILDIKARKKNNGTTECIVKLQIQKDKSKPPRVVTRRFTP